MIGLLSIWVSCSDPLDNVIEYDLRIDNQTEVGYNVFLASNVISGGAFSNVGQIGRMDSITLRNLAVDVQYSVRLAQGDDPEQFDYQQLILSQGDDITWSVP